MVLESTNMPRSNVIYNILVKQEIAKEGVLPFSAFWRSEYTSPFRRLLRMFSSTPSPDSLGVSGEKTPIPALLLHWVSSLILILSPPAGNTYSIYTQLYSYMTLAWFGIFLAGGLLYYGYLKQYISDQRGGKYRWRNIAGFRPWLGPVFPLIYLISCSAVIAGDWIPPLHAEVASGSVKWFVVPTVGMGLFLIGVLYWLVLTQVLPLWNHKTLRVRRTPFLDADENFRYEEVITKWIAGPEEEFEDGDPDLQ